MEYAFVNAIKKISSSKEQSIAFLQGHDELGGIYLADITQTLNEYYNLSYYQIDNKLPFEHRVQNIMKYDVLVIAKPLKVFSEEDKFLIDSYIMGGGRVIWLLDFVNVDTTELYHSGKVIPVYNNLELGEMLFKYGVRINPYLVKDMQAAPIRVAIGEMNNSTQYQNFRWEYTPLVIPFTNHPIVNNINAIKFDYVSNIDTILSEGIKKEPFLFTSKYTKLSAPINPISLESLKQKKDMVTYNKGHQLLGVALSGNFTSAFKNRVKPFKYSGYTDKGKHTRMVVVSDGDIIANQVLKGKSLPLGFDKWTNQQYGNKELIVNIINYLLDRRGLIDVRSKSMKVRLLNKSKMIKTKAKWQFMNLLIPLLILPLLYVFFGIIRVRKYAN